MIAAEIEAVRYRSLNDSIQPNYLDIIEYHLNN
jgi:hypothetical protein